MYLFISCMTVNLTSYDLANTDFLRFSQPDHCSFWTARNRSRRFCLYLSYELHDEVHHQLGVLVEHPLPQLVHHPLSEVEDVVDQDLIAATAAEGQRGVLTWSDTGSERNSYIPVY